MQKFPFGSPSKLLVVASLVLLAVHARAQPPDYLTVPGPINEDLVTNPGAGLADKQDYANWRELQDRGRQMEKTDAPATIKLYQEFTSHPLMTPWAGALATQELIRLQLDGDRIVHEERLLGDLGVRIRDVRQGPDGYLYLLTDQKDGQLLRLGLAR